MQDGRCSRSRYQGERAARKSLIAAFETRRPFPPTPLYSCSDSSVSEFAVYSISFLVSEVMPLRCTQLNSRSIEKRKYLNGIPDRQAPSRFLAHAAPVACPLMRWECTKPKCDGAPECSFNKGERGRPSVAHAGCSRLVKDDMRSERDSVKDSDDTIYWGMNL